MRLPTWEGCDSAVWLCRLISISNTFFSKTCTFLWDAKILLKSTGPVNFQLLWKLRLDQAQWDQFCSAQPRVSCPPQNCLLLLVQSMDSVHGPQFMFSVSHSYPCHRWSLILSILKPSSKWKLFSMAHFYFSSCWHNFWSWKVCVRSYFSDLGFSLETQDRTDITCTSPQRFIPLSPSSRTTLLRFLQTAIYYLV